MYKICKEFSFSAAHSIRGHSGECAQLHGHNYRVRVHLQSEELDEIGMVLDFAVLKQMIQQILEPFDHAVINDVPPFDVLNTTAELVAEYVFQQMAQRLNLHSAEVARVEVWENDTSAAIYDAS